MKFSLENFLNDELTIMEGQGETEVEKTQLRIERITELVVRNGGTFEVQGWGNVRAADPTQNPYGYYGIDINEAMELIKTEAYILGFLDAARIDQEDIDDKKWFEDEVFNKIEQQRKKDVTKKLEEIEKIKEENTASGEISEENEEILNEILDRAIEQLNIEMVTRIDVDEYINEGRVFISPEHLNLTPEQIDVYEKAGYIDDYNSLKRFNVKKLKEEYERQRERTASE